MGLIILTLQSCITNVEVQWSLATEVVTTDPTNIPPIYALVQKNSIRFDHYSTVILTAGQFQLGKAKVTYTPAINNDKMIARVAAKAFILELQHQKLPSSTQKKKTSLLKTLFKKHHNDDETTKETTEKRIIELSLKYNILSPYTAFVGVEKRMNASNTDMVLREVPIQISADDQHLLTHSQMYSNSYMPTSMSSAMYDCDIDQCCEESGLMEPYSYSKPWVTSCHSSSIQSAPNKRLSHDNDEDYEDNSCPLRIDNVPAQTTDISLMNDENIVRYLIHKQKFDGSWQLNENDIERLTGKPMTTFQQMANNEILISAIVISILEIRFASLSSMWYGIVQKARKHLLDCLGKDTNKLNTLLENIRQQFSHSFNEF
ncbi:unnamed protein product [Adineta steineri]|uniref:Uncharacterized protein n=1 Tax=Adineta steineri TaxID=433720 RepID=A0A818MHC9_9BILA|nr:unnamed protein product [Adineta steineri]